jgi:chromosome segregation ATPase
MTSCKDFVWVTKLNDDVDKRFVWVTQPGTEKNNDYEQRFIATNGPSSESLTRLQNGYLSAMAVLEERNRALQQELDNAQEIANGRMALANFNATQRISSLEDEVAILELELNAARSKPSPWRAEIAQLYAALAAKNTTIDEKNNRIVQIERTNRRMQEELLAERRRNGGTGGIDVSTSNSGPSRTMHPSQKKRKHNDLVQEGGGLENA